MKTSTPAVIRPANIKDATGISRSHVYALEKAGSFPRRVKLSERAVGWLKADVDQWLADRVAASRQPTDAA